MSAKKKSLDHPDWWLSQAEFQRVLRWIEAEIIGWLNYEFPKAASDLVATVMNGMASSSGLQPPGGFFAQPRDRRRKLIWNRIHRLVEKREIEVFRRRKESGGSKLLHLRPTSVLDKIAYALDQEDSHAIGGHEHSSRSGGRQASQ